MLTEGVEGRTVCRAVERVISDYGLDGDWARRYSSDLGGDSWFDGTGREFTVSWCGVNNRWDFSTEIEVEIFSNDKNDIRRVMVLDEYDYVSKVRTPETQFFSLVVDTVSEYLEVGKYSG